MSRIDSYNAVMRAAEERRRNQSLFDKMGSMSYTFGGMITGQIKSSPTKPGLMGHAPMSYPQLFTLAFLGFVIVMFVISTLIARS